MSVILYKEVDQEILLVVYLGITKGRYTSGASAADRELVKETSLLHIVASRTKDK